MSINISKGQQQNTQIENINTGKGERLLAEMEQPREEAQQRQKQPYNPIRCPRCYSLNTRFGYFNNNSPTQPRHHCRTCKRQWTVGGRLRLIPVGGNARNGKRTKALSSGGGNSRSPPLQPPLPEGEHQEQNPTLMNVMASQDFDTTLFQPIADMVEAASPFNDFSDQIPFLYATQNLIQQVSNQHINATTLSTSDDTNMRIPQEWNVQTVAPEQDLSEKNPITFECYQTQNEAINAPQSHLNINSVVQHASPVNSLDQEIACNSSFTMSRAYLQKNLNGDAADTEDTNFVNVDEWLNFPESGSTMGP